MKKRVQSYKNIISKETNINIREDYKSGLSIRDLLKKYSIKSSEYIRSIIKGLTRTLSEADKVSHQLHPENFKHTSESKAKLREIRLKFMKEHPEKTAWRKRNKPSYPEECFIKYIKDRKLDEKYTIEREKSFFPYFADFAFEQLKLVVEIDGSQHLNSNRRESDIKKDEIIRNAGWKVIRLTENLVKTDWITIDSIFSNLDNIDNSNTKTFGIFKCSKKKYMKQSRLETGLTQKQVESNIKQRKTSWPSKEELSLLIKTESFVSISKKYNVTDNAVRKWCKHYNLPYKKKDINAGIE